MRIATVQTQDAAQLAVDVDGEQRRLELDRCRAGLEEGGELLDEGGLDGIRVLARCHVEHHEPEGRTVDESPCRGVRAEGDLLTPHEPADQARIFQDFAQVEGPIQRRVRGTGLGLRIVQTIVRNHHGTMTLDSVESEGTAVTLRLPLRPQFVEDRSAMAALGGEQPGPQDG